MKPAKFRSRSKWKYWQLRRQLGLVKWLLVALMLGAGARLGAGKLREMEILPVKSFEINRDQNHDFQAPWEKILTDEVIGRWQGKSRLRCALGAGGLARDLGRKHPYLKDVHVHWWELVFGGNARLDFAFRMPVAAARVSGRTVCLDRGGFAFACPSGFDAGRLIGVGPGLEGEALRRALAAAESLHDVLLPAGQITAMDLRGRGRVLFRLGPEAGLELALADLEPGRLGAIAAKLGVLLRHFQNNEEKFKYIDGGLINEGRVMVHG
ncbi:MAG: hypothetical protein HYT79_06665 [Elusimicrobia bacterium]|nr:hypothetical protein [Elusimicrobiota bacterium]